jgi:hypothetical protein
MQPQSVDSLSTVSAHAESEFAYPARRGMRELAEEQLCCACHGLSYFTTGFLLITDTAQAGMDAQNDIRSASAEP